MKAFRSRTDLSIGVKLIISLVAAIIVASALALFAPIFILNEYLEQEKICIIICVIHTITAFSGTFVMGKMLNDNLLLAAVLFNLTWFAILLSVGILVFDNSFQNVFLGVVSCCTGGIASIPLLIKSKKPTIRRKKRGKHY